MAEVQWIKIVTDIFDDEKILLIENMPDADSMIVIWFKLLCLAGKQNNSGVFMINDRIPYTDEMFASIFRRPLNTVRLALKTFEQFGMVEIINNTVTIPNWEKHQRLDQLEQAKEATRKRVAKHREKQKLIASPDCNVTCNVTDPVTVTSSVTPCNGDREDKKRKDKNREDIYISVISHLNEKAGTNYRASSQATRELINGRLSEGFTVDDFKKVIDKKCAEWKGSEMEKYLRPETLFKRSKFESYLNEPVSKPAGKLNRGAKAYDPDKYQAPERRYEDLNETEKAYYDRYGEMPPF